ncbi:unnamed protein product [Vitrella brassicaformis CCMP3155]|uniref:Uncharacterized protein n=2 Tax=Vitrella brassicaformis TaxID=1169539 RepID=A0A0G4H818_VITBC|nr:unnamed protein product [Vitrella brassicaformis CCMP3155]|eukprot:CEM39927.1 unnamed protein product [Vitrella brassicaformis CCMP3155]
MAVLKRIGTFLLFVGAPVAAGAAASAYREANLPPRGPYQNVKDLKDAIVVVTGANTGIGKAAVHQLAQRGCHVIMACRDVEAGRRARMDIEQALANPDSVHIEVIRCDLADLHSIRHFVDEVSTRYHRIYALVNNAGCIQYHPTRTRDGADPTLYVNFLGPALLTELMLPCLRRAGTQERKSRVVHVNSRLQYISQLDATAIQQLMKRRTSYMPTDVIRELAKAEHEAAASYSTQPQPTQRDYASYYGVHRDDDDRPAEPDLPPLHSRLMARFRRYGEALQGYAEKAYGVASTGVRDSLRMVGAKAEGEEGLRGVGKQRWNSSAAYANSKLLQMMHCKEMAKRFREEGAPITCNAVTPGMVNTDLFRSYPMAVRVLTAPIRRMFMRTPSEGAELLTWAVTSEELNDSNGEFFADRKAVRVNDAAKDEFLVDMVASLWRQTARQMFVLADEAG